MFALMIRDWMVNHTDYSWDALSPATRNLVDAMGDCGMIDYWVDVIWNIEEKMGV